jgi:excisionase family DNA binding protein
VTTATLPRLLTVAEVADALRFSRAHIRRLIANGQLRSIKTGPDGWHRIPESELERLLGTDHEEAVEA